MTRVDDLKVALSRLTAWRVTEVQRLEAELRKVNREYDTRATALSREIAKLEPVIGVDPGGGTPKPPKPPIKRKPQRDIAAEVNAYNREHGLPEVTW